MVEAERVLRPLRQALTPVADRIGPISYVQIKETLHSRVGTVLRRITEAAAQTLIDRFPSVPSPRSFFVFQQVGGAVSACTHEKLRNSQGPVAQLPVASLVSWTVWVAKSIELFGARAAVRRGLRILASSVKAAMIGLC
jgi:hypothetical protein